MKLSLLLNGWSNSTLLLHETATIKQFAMQIRWLYNLFRLDNFSVSFFYIDSCEIELRLDKMVNRVFFFMHPIFKFDSFSPRRSKTDYIFLDLEESA